MKKASDLTAEVLALKQAVEALQKQAEQKATTKVGPNDNKATRASAIEQEAKTLLSELCAQAKNDYEHLSPITALLIFATGVALGGSIGRGLGVKS